MGTLGKYLQDARQAMGIDLRDAAQQTRISHQYLKALEEEDFARLPGDVFVKGFLKSYAKFLRLDESEVMKRFVEAGKRPPAAAPASAEQPKAAVAAPSPETSRFSKTPIEPFIWGTGIIVILAIFLFVALPERREQETHPALATTPTGTEIASSPASTAGQGKLYLEVVALDSTWLLVRTDTSPQKKSVLNKGDSLIWSADERFHLSYGNAGALKLLLNGEELTVNEPRGSVVRDLEVTAKGVVDRKVQSEQPRPVKPKPRPVPAPEQPQQALQPQPAQVTAPPQQPEQTAQPKPTPPARRNPPEDTITNPPAQ